MSDLHWLYRYGVEAGYAFLALTTLAGGALAHGRAKVLAARRAKDARLRMAPPVTTADATPAAEAVTFEGTLVSSDGAGGTAIDVSSTRKGMAAPIGLALRLSDGTAIPMTGPFHLHAGTFEGRRHACVNVGDRVVVRGHVVRTASTDRGAKNYRAASFEISLTARPLIDVVATGRRRVQARLQALASFSLTGLLLGILISSSVGLSAVAGPPGDGTQLTANAIAAATPSRSRALGRLRDRLEADPADKGNVRRAIDVSTLLGDCVHAASLWLALDDAAAAERLAATCGIPVLGDAYVVLGEVKLASTAYTRAQTVSFAACSTHVAAKQFTEAAECTRQLARARESGQDPGSRERAQALGCIADALDARGGRWAAMASLRNAANERAMCRVLLADLLQGEERLALFSDRLAGWAWRDANGMDFAKGRVVQTFLRLEEETTGPLSNDRYKYSVFPGAVLTTRPSWESAHRSDMPICLMASLLERGNIPEDAYAYRAMLAGNVAQFHATLVEFDDARRALAEARDDAGRKPDNDYEWTTPTHDSLARAVEQLDVQPNLGSRLLGPAVTREDATIWAVLDELAAARRDARAHHLTGPAVAVRRLREAVLQRDTCVPLHMMQAFDVR